MANITIQDILDAMLPAQQAIGLKKGVDLEASADTTLRAAVETTDAVGAALIIAVLVQTGVKMGNGQPLTLSTFSSGLDTAVAQDYKPVPPPIIRT